MSNDDLWLADIFSNAQPAPGEPLIQLIPLYDYEDALRYTRVFRIKLDNGTPLDADIEQSLQCPCRTRFVAHWIPAPWGVMAFCGIFFKAQRPRRAQPVVRNFQSGRRAETSDPRDAPPCPGRVQGRRQNGTRSTRPPRSGNQLAHHVQLPLPTSRAPALERLVAFVARAGVDFTTFERTTPMDFRDGAQVVALQDPARGSHSA